MRKFVATVALAALASTTVLADARDAHAQTVNEVSPTGKGIVGCALLGAETVMLIEAAAGARPGWAYILGGVLGAGAGAAGGCRPWRGEGAGNGEWGAGNGGWRTGLRLL